MNFFHMAVLSDAENGIDVLEAGGYVEFIYGEGVWNGVKG